jgi:hypothetical protein
MVDALSVSTINLGEPDSAWKQIYQVAGIADLLTLVFIPIQMIVLFISSRPTL